jgi:hypothetical protein
VHDPPPVFPGGPVDRWRKSRKATADAKVREATKALDEYRRHNGIPLVEFWKPPYGKADRRDARIKRQYTAGPGWLRNERDEHGPYWIAPPPSPVSESPAVETPPVIPVVADAVESPVIAPDLNPADLPAENQDTGPSVIEVMPMMNLRTIGQLAKELKVDQHKALYVIRVRGIQPVARAGAYRLFDTAAVKRIDHELRKIASER